jgi:FKBP-type peptidyl-prolyl cis-trans isomerase FkpA
MLCRVLPVMLLVLSAACGGSSSPSTPTPLPSAPYSQTDLVVGTGAEAVSGKTATIHYSVWIYSDTAAENKGTFIQTSVGGTPFSFAVGGSGVIQGVNQGVTGMKVGGKRRLIIPPDLAYGSTGNGSIPPNATLVFEAELVSVQ